MNLATLSIRRPIFITCVVIVMLSVGYLCLKRLPVDLFPDVTFPVVTVTTQYRGAGPSEVETQISKVLEEEISTLPGIKTLSSVNKEGFSTVIAEFSLETDVKYAEQQIRDRVASAKRKLPDDIEEPVIRRIDPADQPILILAFSADLPPGKLFELADDFVKPKLEQVNKVGLVEIGGGREREIHVELDREKLKLYEVSATQVATQIASAGENIPAGKLSQDKQETVYRTLGEFKSIKDIEKTVVNFMGNDVPVTVAELGKVTDNLEDERSRTYVNGKRALTLMLFRQSGSNTISVVEGVYKRVSDINKELASMPGDGKVEIVRNAAKFIRANVDDVKEAIMIGIGLTILVVFFFLGSGRSTIITGLALPNSLLGAFILMAAMGFTINVMSLLALSLAVGLLIDDAIVVRENIFRHVEMGKTPVQASIDGTKEVTLAVVATTLTVIAVFGPIGFLQGVVGQFFKQFGLTICFAMAISLFDALTMAPMLSAFFAGTTHGISDKGLWGKTAGRALRKFDRFQTFLEDTYERVLRYTLKRPVRILVGALLIFFASFAAVSKVPKTFLPAQDAGEFAVIIDMPPGTSLEAMDNVADQVDKVIRQNKEVETSIRIIGGREGEANVAQFFIELVPSKQRSINTSLFKERIRQQLQPFAYAKPKVQDIDMVAGGQRPFNINIIGSNLQQLEEVSQKVLDKLKAHPGLKDVDTSHKPGKPEFQVAVDNRRAERLGVSTKIVGQELRTHIEGIVPAVFREEGREYDIRVRLREEQRNLQKGFEATLVPNINNRLVRLSDVARPVAESGPANITRQDRGRYIQISGDLTPGGVGMGAVMQDTIKLLENDIKLPPGMRYKFVGQAENFKELGENMVTAVLLGILFIYLVLASLYESFITPFTIMLVLPLAACGAFYALFITQSSLDIFSMIGCVMLLGLATKNSILLVDYANQLVAEGSDRGSAIIRAGKMRLRPILMTSFALIAGMLPIALGLNEASKQRTSMGIAVIGGLISSTFLTLVVIPASYSYIDRFRVWSNQRMKKLFGVDSTKATVKASAKPQTTDSPSLSQEAPKLN
ncbi:MAG: efflux RND transporter permease subunit [Bdellovibrionota bacterium]